MLTYEHVAILVYIITTNGQKHWRPSAISTAVQTQKKQHVPFVAVPGSWKRL